MILSTLHVIFAGSASPYLTGLLITLGIAIFAMTFDTFILPISSFFSAISVLWLPWKDEVRIPVQYPSDRQICSEILLKYNLKYSPVHR